MGSGSFAYAVAIQSDGKIVAAESTSNGSNYVFALARYNTDGSLDISFAGGTVITAIGSGNDSYVYAVAIQSDGKIVAAGFAANGSNYRFFALARYNTNGSLDTTFGTGGKVMTNTGSSLSGTFVPGHLAAIQSDGKIVAVNSELNGGGSYFLVLMRYWP